MPRRRADPNPTPAVVRAARRAAGCGPGLQAVLAPPRCVCCRGLAEVAGEGVRAAAGRVVICCRCERSLPRARARLPPGVGLGWVAVPLSWEGSGRELVAALKFRRLAAVAGLAAELIAAELPPLAGETLLAPVPAAPRRRRSRGFDPAELIAVALGELLGLVPVRLLRRTDAGRQRGRGRAERLARRPRFEVIAAPASPVVLVDDVVTTGATLAACAAALERGGVRPIGAVALAQTPPPGTRRLNYRRRHRMIGKAPDAANESGGRT